MVALNIDKMAPIYPHLDTLTMHSGVYELTLDKATGKSKPLFKQTNGKYLVKGIHLYRRLNVSYREIMEEVTPIFENYPEPLKELHIYPLIVHQPVKDSDWVQEDDKRNYLICYGFFVQRRKNDPHQPIIVQAPADDVEARSQAIHDALQPYYVDVPFVLMAPEDPRYMFYLSFDHTPPGAISEWDSSKHDVDPALNADEPLPIDDIQAANMTQEDIAKRDAIRMELEKQIDTARKVSADPNVIPEGWTPDEESMAEAGGFSSVEEMRNFMKKCGILVEDVNQDAPELPKTE